MIGVRHTIARKFIKKQNFLVSTFFVNQSISKVSGASFTKPFFIFSAVTMQVKVCEGHSDSNSLDVDI